MRDRRPDNQSLINRLERRHGQLDVEVAHLERKQFLSDHDQLRVKSMKKEKLAAKDALVDLIKRV